MDECSDVAGISETEDGLVFEHLDENEAEFIYEEIFVQRCYAPSEPVIAERPVILDVGANIGLFTLWALREWPSAAIVCFEPVPPIVKVLRRNVGARAFVVHTALADAEQDICPFYYFPSKPGESTRHLIEREAQRKLLESEAAAKGITENQIHTPPIVHHAKVQKLSTVLKQLRQLPLFSRSSQVVDLLKIDAEGDEESVLDGIDQSDWHLIQRAAIEVHDLDGRLNRITEKLQTMGLSNVRVEWQKPTVCEGYASFVPECLRLARVSASRVEASEPTPL